MTNRNRYFILGASSDIGKAYLIDLDEKLKEKHETGIVIAHYAHDKEELEKLAEKMDSLTINPFQANLANKDEVELLIAYAKDVLSVPDYILQFAAKPFAYMRMKQFDWDRIMEDMEIQVHSLGRVLKHFLPDMSNQKFGKIVVMLTAYTIGVPPKYMSNYMIVKYALLGLMKSAAIEYAGKGININAVSPNMMETKFLQNIDERTVEMTANASTMGRNIHLDEVLPAIHFLLSEGSSYMNGENLNLSGGDRM